MRRLALAIVAVVLAVGVGLASSGQVKVTPVVSEGRVLASFTVEDAWTSETRDLLQSGLVLTFSFDVELRRPSAVWLDAVLARASVSASAKFDTLTGGYQVSRLRDGRVVRSERRDQETEVRDWMTSFEQVQLDPASPLAPNGEYYVRVRLYTSPRRSVSLWSIWPFGRDDSSGRAGFTYIR